MQINKVFFIISWITLFLLSGIIGHDPWKQDETYSFGIINHFHTNNTWLVPTNGGIPFMEKPPLYYWTAIILSKVFGKLLPLHDAARLTSFFYMIIASCFIWKSAAITTNGLRKTESSWIALFLFLGSLGVVRHSHDMFTDVSLLAGSTITFYGIASLICKNEMWKASGFWLGIGIGITFLSKGLFMPTVFILSGIFLLMLLPSIRTRNTLNSLLIALLVSSPFLLIWPITLYHYSYDLFMHWFWENNIGRLLGFSVEKLGAGNSDYYILYTTLWFAFPVFPLAMIAAWSSKKQFKKPEFLLPITISAIGLSILLISASARALYILPLIPAFTMLAINGLFTIPDNILVNWNKIMRIIFGIIVILLWVIWLSLQSNYHLPLIEQELPFDFVPTHSQIPAIITSVVATLFWLISLRVSTNLQANTAFDWFSNIAIIWIVTNTLLLPWIDETKSYRSIIAQMYDYKKHSPYRNYCINDYNLGESIAPMLEYFGEDHKLNTVTAISDANCQLILTVTRKNSPPNIANDWNLVWKGSRVLDKKNEELRLYVKK